MRFEGDRDRSRSRFGGGRRFGGRSRFGGEGRGYGRQEEFREEESEREEKEYERPEFEAKGPTKIVFPGDELADSLEIVPGPGTFREGGKILSKIIGIERRGERVVAVAPLSGVYVPRRGDYVIGEVKDIAFSNWTIEINSPYEAQLSVMDTKEYIPKGVDITRYYTAGDLIFAKVSVVTTTKFINLTMRDPRARKLIGGLVTNITPAKVPRLIGHGGSMVNMIKEKTACSIIVGQNGRVWVKGEYEDIAAEAIEMVNRMAHLSGLTDKVGAMIDEKLKARGVTLGKLAPAASEPEESEGTEEFAQNSSEERKEK